MQALLLILSSMRARPLRLARYGILVHQKVYSDVKPLMKRDVPGRIDIVMTVPSSWLLLDLGTTLEKNVLLNTLQCLHPDTSIVRVITF